MGVIITTKCKNCSLEKTFCYGGGFDSVNSNDKETINEYRESFSGEARKAVLAAISAGVVIISIKHADSLKSRILKKNTGQMG